MEASRQQRVLAVGIDSAEPTLIRNLIDRGELPALASLLERGEWALVDAGAKVASGAVWPTFFTGTDPAEHQCYSGWAWNPDQMACTGVDDYFFADPFWKPLSDGGLGIGVLDVPWAPVTRITDGFELSEWGPHEGRHGGPRVAPGRAERIAARSGRHPFHVLPHGPGQTDDREGRQRLSSACLAGAELRGELAARLISDTRPALSIVVFSEIHRLSHHLWETVEPDDPLYARYPTPPGHVEPGLTELYREVDRQIGRIVEAAGPDTAVMAFSLHGMKPGPGIPMVHGPFLEALGFSKPTRWRGLSWRDRGAALFGAAKSHAPARLRRLYYSRASFRTIRWVAQPSMVAPHDWSRTRAFTIPSDQRAYLRINLAGREAKGIVPPRDYEALCDELIDALREFRSTDGEPLVRNVLRVAEDRMGPPKHLPDLIVDWEEAAFARPVAGRIGSVEFESYPIRTDITGQHSPHGFCILGDGLADGSVGRVVAGKDLHRMLLAPLAEPARAPG
jgi:predicted AlkP superfamily phosphohydrolase/phosphomutase